MDHLPCAVRGAIKSTLAELRRELEISIVLVSHDPEQARRLGDWVVRLDHKGVLKPGSSGVGGHGSEQQKPGDHTSRAVAAEVVRRRLAPRLALAKPRIEAIVPIQGSAVFQSDSPC
jgi:ABC-type nitrate/sulfonate/bicarbonate transport system ATPase subunit